MRSNERINSNILTSGDPVRDEWMNGWIINITEYKNEFMMIIAALQTEGWWFESWPAWRLKAFLGPPASSDRNTDGPGGTGPVRARLNPSRRVQTVPRLSPGDWQRWNQWPLTPEVKQVLTLPDHAEAPWWTLLVMDGRIDQSDQFGFYWFLLV